jgi:hypothetical protein
VAPRVIDQLPAHLRRHKPKEGLARLNIDGLIPEQPEIRLVHQRGGLQGMVAALVSKEGPGKTPQLVVRRSQQLVGRVRVAFTPAMKEARDVGWVSSHGHLGAPAL